MDKSKVESSPLSFTAKSAIGRERRARRRLPKACKDVRHGRVQSKCMKGSRTFEA